MNKTTKKQQSIEAVDTETLALDQKSEQQAASESLKKEINGPKGLEPTRYGDWESKGRCYDF